MQLDSDEIGLLLLPQLVAQDPTQPVIWNNFRQRIYGQLDAEGLHREEARAEALARLAAGWQWLRNAGYLSPHPSHTDAAHETPTAEARQARAPGLADPQLMAVLSRWPLTYAVASRVVPIFRRGAYSAAVFQAYLELEERIRASSRLRRLHGVDLAKQAFAVGGPLAVLGTPGDQQALMALFWGAIGTFRNEGGHRPGVHEDPHEALALILLADRLIQMTDEAAVSRRRQRRQVQRRAQRAARCCGDPRPGRVRLARRWAIDRPRRASP